MSTRPTWTITLRAPAGDTDERATRRIRAALKTLGRNFQLTATSVIKVQAEKPAPVSEEQSS